MRESTFRRLGLTGIIGMLLTFLSCQKTNFGSDSGIYPDSTHATAVKFLSARVSPTNGSVGTIVTVLVSGLAGKKDAFKVYVGATEASVESISATSITIKIPAGASTGNITIEFNGQLFYGPKFSVSGKVYIDPDFNFNKFQATGAIYGMLPYGQDYIIYGSISKYEGSSFSGMTYISNTGDTTKAQPYFGPQSAASTLSPAVINSLVQLSDGNFLMGGNFTTAYTSKNVSLTNLNGVARLFTNGSIDGIDTLSYQVPNADPHNYPERSYVTGSAINGGVDGNVIKAFPSNDNAHYILVGNFSKYLSIYYPGSLYNSFQVDKIEMKQIVSMKADGSFDSTFNYNFSTHSSLPATNAIINDAVQSEDGNIILVGSFTTYNGAPANHIVKIDASTGAIDPSFFIGSGFDGLVTSITYNKILHRFLVTGLFKTYNGTYSKNVVMLKDDGTIDASFKIKDFTDGFPTFAKQLNNGLIICAGAFATYNGVSRPGFAILDKNGTLSNAYNNTGNFNGTIYDVVETTSRLSGQPAVFLVGSFDKFDATSVSNIVKVVIEN